MKTKKVLLFFIILLLSFSFCFAEPVEIRILYVNDFHGFAESYRTPGSERLLGGVSYLAGLIDNLRREKPTILLSAGDMIQGNNWANLTEGKSVIELMNAMSFDAMVVGNHEFDFGLDVLKKRISESSFFILGANVYGFDGLKPYIIKELSGVKIGIIGVITEDTPKSTHPKNVVGLKFFSVEDTVKKYLKELNGKADVIVVLSHIGFFADRLLAQNVRGIDIIVGGHSHTKVEKPLMIGKTIIVQAWEHGKALGVLDLTLENGKTIKFEGQLKEIGPEIGFEDTTIKAIVDKYEKIVNATLGETIGTAICDLEAKDVRKKETSLGNLIADIIREKAGADIAIVNGGSIRTDILKGEIKIRDVYTVLPFDNYIVAIKMSGKKVKESIEHGVSAVEGDAGSFPQVSGIRFTYNPNAPPGGRIKEIYVGDKPLDEKKRIRGCHQ
ncbi:MAG: bifunctional metallophosphatase/5'-nucleotidase [Syntrophorhabdaceae bacterium]|nr:bifunctional metallophosphatase/5'-nucleotidase [Syntrophorhabdaceae bacterium]